MMAQSIRLASIPLYLFACLLIGGSSRASWANMLLQLGAIAIIAWALLAQPRIQSGRPGTNLAYLVGALIALVLIQLIPLPPEVWSALPGRKLVVHGFALLGQPLPWLALSLSPYDTMTSALWLLPPLAMLAGILRLGAYRELWLAIALVLAAFAGVMLGALQITSGDPLNSPWYLYAVTNHGQAVGFFANSNHMATLLVVTVPFLVAMFDARRIRSRRMHASAGKIAILVGAMMVILLGIGLNHSLAGFGLGTTVVAASLFIRAPLDRPQTRRALSAVGVLGLLAVGALFVSPLQNNLTAAGADKDYSSRYTSFGNSLRATADQFPVGSGVGSFVDLYPAYENPQIVDRYYMNHVHNDFIEVALETGLPGILLLIAFLVLWAGRVVAVWLAPEIDTYGRAASIASAAILAHSLVDFPLRTSAIAALFAMCVALMARPRRWVGAEKPAIDDEEAARHLSVG